MPLPRLLRTSSFRLTLLYAGLFVGSVMVLFATIDLAISGYLTDQLDHVIDAEITSLNEEARLLGKERLVAIVSQRATATPRTGAIYLLEDAEGRLLAGTLRQRKPVIGWMSFRGRSRAAEGDEPHRIRARGVRLEDGRYLLVGQDANSLDQVQDGIIRAFGWSAAATLVLAIGGGMLMSAGILRRIAAMAQASRAVMAGDLAERIPHRGVGDEFDQLADALNAMIARIEALMEGLRQVSNDIAHDLRTPLSRLRQRLEAVERSSPSLADYEALVGKTVEEVDAILATFAAMLRIAEVEAATQKAGFAAIDLSQLLETVVEVYEPLAVERSDTLTGTIEPGLTVDGDRELLTQLFANLVQNALAHTPNGTAVTVDTTRTGATVEVIVADTGPGIAEGEREKVFRRFYRVEASRKSPGSGLGLSLVRAVAALHGASIELLDNRPGLRVHLSFPAAKDEPTPQALTPSA